jgi:hypothetical protein
VGRIKEGNLNGDLDERRVILPFIEMLIHTALSSFDLYYSGSLSSHRKPSSVATISWHFQVLDSSILASKRSLLENTTSLPLCLEGESPTTTMVCALSLQEYPYSLTLVADVGSYTYGTGHPMKPHRIRLAHELIGAYSMFDRMQIMVRRDSFWLLCHPRVKLRM